jgi:hypothetical protein
MRIYIFKSEARIGLGAFAGDPMGGKLPQNHGPWTVTGVVGVDLLLITSRVTLSSKQSTTQDFNFGALGRMETRNPQTDKKGRPILKTREKFRTLHCA